MTATDTLNRARAIARALDDATYRGVVRGWDYLGKGDRPANRPYTVHHRGEASGRPMTTAQAVAFCDGLAAARLAEGAR